MKKHCCPESWPGTEVLHVTAYQHKIANLFRYLKICCMLSCLWLPIDVIDAHLSHFPPWMVAFEGSGTEQAMTSQTVVFPNQLKWEGAYWVEETFYLLNGLMMRLVWLLSIDLSPKQNCQLNLYISTVMLYDLPLIKQQFQCACLSIQDFYEPTGWTGHKFITPFHVQNF